MCGCKINFLGLLYFLAIPLKSPTDSTAIEQVKLHPWDWSLVWGKNTATAS